MNYSIKKSITKESKFQKLNANLKNEISVFLPIDIWINIFSLLNKRFIISLKNNILFKDIKRNFSYIISSKINFFDSEDIENLKRHFSNLLSIDDFYKVCGYFFSLKNRLSEKFQIGLYLGESYYHVSEFKSIQGKQNYEISFEALKLNKNLKYLKLCFNPLEDNIRNFTKLLEVFKINSYLRKNLKVLEINKLLGINSENIKLLSEILKENIFIEELNLQHNELGINEENIFHICEALKTNISIKRVNLTYNKLYVNESNLKFISETLTFNKTIISLNLSLNRLGSKVNYIKKLSEGIKENKSLIEINLNKNDLEQYEDSMKYICDALTFNKRIEILDI